MTGGDSDADLAQRRRAFLWGIAVATAVEVGASFLVLHASHPVLAWLLAGAGVAGVAGARARRRFAA